MSASGKNIGQQQHQMAVIKRSQHNIKLAGALNSMLQCGSLVDVTIYCDDGQVNAHKLVLAASSTYFRNLFSRMNNAFHYPIIVLREMQVIDLKTIIQFIYHGEVNVPQNRVDSLMRCADYLQIDGMASSANSLNAILASSSTSMSTHHPLLTGAHSSTNPVSATSNLHLNTASSNANLNKLHPQYPQANCNTQSSTTKARGRNNNNATTSNSNTTDTSGKPKHTCPVCLKTFTHGFTLKRHMKLHSQSRLTIYCDVCSKSYSCKDSYLRHKKSSGHMHHAGSFHHRSIDMNIGSER